MYQKLPQKDHKCGVGLECIDSSSLQQLRMQLKPPHIGIMLAIYKIHMHV